MRILLLQTAFLGDIVMTIPLVRELRRLRPGAEIHLLTTEIGRDALAGMSEIDRWLILDKRWNRPGTRSYLRLIRTLMREQFDVGIAAQRSFRTGLMLRLANPAIAIGFEGAPGGWAYGRSVRWREHAHAVDRYLGLALPLGDAGESVDRTPRLSVTETARQTAVRLLQSYGISERHPLAVIAPGSRRETKRWGVDGFARVAVELERRGLTVLLVGSNEEQALCRDVARRSGLGLPQLAGRTSIGVLAALLERSEIVVANDSGSAHVAAAVGTPLVAIFGPTAPTQGYVPRGTSVRVVERDDLSCRPCGTHGARRCPLRHHACMLGLESAPVLSAIDELLSTDRTSGMRRAHPAVARPG